MTREDWMRLGIHLPWGLLAAILLIPHIAIGITALASEFIYEIMNDWRKGDSSYRDALGITWGFLIGAFTLWGLGFFI